MFTKDLWSLDLTQDVAETVFPNIVSFGTQYDLSFLATLRALLYSRISKEDSIRLTTHISGEIIYVDDFATPDEVVDAYINRALDVEDNDRLFYFSVNGSKTYNDKIFDAFDKAFTEQYKGYVELREIKEFTKSQIDRDVHVFVNEYRRSTVIFVYGGDSRIWHYMQSYIPRYFPWYFKDSPITDQERELVKSLLSKSSVKYERCIKEVASKFDFRAEKIKVYAKQFERRGIETAFRRSEQDVSNIRRDIDRNLINYENLIARLEEQSIRRDGLKAQLDNLTDSTELSDFLAHNKYINVIGIDDSGNMCFIVGTTIEIYEPTLLEHMKEKDNSYLYKGYAVPQGNIFADFDKRKRLVDELFGDEARLRIKVCSYYEIGARGHINGHQKYPYPKPDYEDYLTNPHFYFFNCLGTYKGSIADALLKGNYVDAICQCVNSAKTINLAEGAQTVAPFMGQIFSSNKKIILLPDGTSCTTEEAYNWLVEQDEKTEEA